MRGGIFLICALLSTAVCAQDERESSAAERKVGTAWFGVHLPPEQRDPAVVVGDRSPRLVTLPSGEAANPEFIGTTIR
ncbi:MAG TPA: hypothetical protein VK629_00325, partial [Steroidobacteraceae bacterium]|nr:hypothetical protein [Steroidobacteraceae bacterium]